MEESVAISSITNYSINFFNELSKTESVVASPLSVEYLLALLTLGSTDPAHEEILSVLKIKDDNAVESKTNKKIKDLLHPDSVDGSTKLVLVNALYFKGTWQKQFDPNDTRDMSFYLHPTKRVPVPTMQIEDDLWYGDSRDLEAQFLRLYYVGEESYMLIILPHNIGGLNDVLKKLSEGFDLLAEVDKMWPRIDAANIPKFKIETTIDLSALLPQLGIEDIFDPFHSGLTKLLNGDEPLYVTNAIQKAFIEINEEGAEAAAASAICMGFALSETGPMTYTFYADRPFLGIIFINGVPQFMAAYRGDV